MHRLLTACVVPLLVAAARAQDEGPFSALPLRAGDRVCLVGNALAERMQHDGWLETRLQCRAPGLGLAFRNLGFSADEVGVRQRVAGFGSPDEHLERCDATLVLAFFGFDESFAGAAGVEAFEAELTEWVRHVQAQRYDGEHLARVVLCSTLPLERAALEARAFDGPGDASLPDFDACAARLALYDAAIARTAEATGAAFVDLGPGMRAAYEAAREPLTLNGLFLNERGNAALARVLERALLGQARPFAVDAERLAAVRAEVLDKNLLWFNRYRATDGYNVYGGRSALKYTDDLSNYTVLQRELEVLDALVAHGDRRIRALASGEAPPARPERVPAQIPVVTNRPGEGPGGAHVYLDPEAAIELMTPASSARVELFASEEDFPELVNPVQLAFDTRGRLWVAAWHTYPHWKPGEPMDDKLLILEDTDGDGRADRRTVFAGDLHNPTGFELWNGGVLVANAPDLLFLRDTDGDDVYDVRERVLHGLSSGDTHHSANSFVLGPDGALYFQEGVFHQSQVETVFGPVRNHDACVWRFEPRTWRVERYVPYGFANPHGHVFDRWGQDFVTDGTGNVNYYALPFSGHIDEPAKQPGYFPFFQQRSRPAAGTELLSSACFPAEQQGDYLIANVIGFQGLFQYHVRDDGSGFGADEVEPLVSSSDPRFRPSDVEVGPDGAVYFLDWHNALIGHMQHHLRDPSRDHDHGRVYRVVRADRPPHPVAPIAGRPLAELLELLKSPEDRVRYRTRIELSARDSHAVVAAARTWAAQLDEADPEVEHHRLEALWLQQQHDALDQALLERVLRSPDPRARAAATRVLRGMRRKVERPLELLRRQVADEHPRVRLEAVVALSFFPTAEAAETALLALEAPTDRFLDYALAQTLRTLRPQWVAALADGAPFCAENEAGLEYVLARAGTEDLARVRPSAPLFRELLRRPGLARDEYLRAARGLAQREGGDAAAALLAAIHRADASTAGDAGALLRELFGALGSLDDGATLEAPLAELAADGARPLTRRLATVARLRSPGALEPVWQAAAAAPGALADLLDALPLLDDPAAGERLFPRVLALVDAPAVEDASETRGRYVRVELPGEARTLTLAEVQVLRDGRNLAPRGTATQSTVAWGGAPERALDGNTSGRFGDGGQTHTLEDQRDPWWELDLGAEQPIDAIVLWNRGEQDGLYAARLDGWVVRVLDAARRTVFVEHGGAAPLESVAIELGDPGLRVRRAALRTLPRLGAREEEAVRALVARFGAPELRGTVVDTLADVPLERWPEDCHQLLGAELLSLFLTEPPERFDDDAGRALLALADTLRPALEPDLAARLRAVRRGLGPQVLELRPVPDSLTYDRARLTVLASRPVELRFENVDVMPHNVVVAARGALAKVGLEAERTASAADAWDRGYVPALPEVLHATRLLQPGESQTLHFDAPAEPGDYPYVCTFPGHWVRMNGVLRVVTDLADAPDEERTAATPDAPARPFVRSWTLDDLRPSLAQVDAASPQRGAEILEAASCTRCHAIRNKVPTVGPDLSEVVTRYEREALLQQVLEPSKNIAEGYETELFVTTDGHVYAGKVLEETDTLVVLRDDPYGQIAPLELPKDEIESRARYELSTMPTGLLSTFEREEILDLLAYLESLREDGE